MRWILGLVAVAAVVGFILWLIPDREPETPYADALLDALDRGKLEQVRQNFQAAHIALAGYSTEQGGYPEAADIREVAQLVSPAYIHSLPVTDPWGRLFLYSSNGTSYELRCAGQDGAPNSGDDVVMRDGSIQMPKGFREVEIR